MEFEQTVKKKTWTAIICIVLLALTLGTLSACSGIFGKDSDPTKYYIEIGKVEDSRVANFVFNNAHPSCVRIISEYKKSGNTVVATSASSGFVITEDGYVLTNRHCVVRYASNSSDTPMLPSDTPMRANYRIVFTDNTEYSATLFAFSSSSDIAVLKISKGILSSVLETKFQPLVFDKELPYYGDRLYTIGNPENIGLLLTELMVSSPGIQLGKNDAYKSIILDGNINHGNSGGALLNANSRVSGIIYARVDGTNNDTYGIGCAIPTSEIIKFLDSVTNADINYQVYTAQSSGDVTQ